MKTSSLEDHPSIGESWKSARKRIFTPEEIAESDLRVALIGELNAAARKEKARRCKNVISL